MVLYVIPPRAMNVIAIGPGHGFLGSSASLFQHQSTDDIYFSNYFGPSEDHGIPGFWSQRHIRVHVECSNTGRHFITLQSNAQGGHAYMQAVQNNPDQVQPWNFSPCLVLAGKLSVHDYGSDENLFAGV